MEETPIAEIERLIPFKSENISVHLEYYNEGTTDTRNAIITGSVTRNNRRLLKIRIVGNYADPFVDGILVSAEKGEVRITYDSGKKETFTLVNTSVDDDYSRRTQPITLTELDKQIEQRLDAIEKRITPEEYLQYHLEKEQDELNDAVKRYVEHGNDRVARNTITDYIDKLWPTLDNEITVYRGQLNAQEIKTSPAPPRYFFSTSEMDSVSTGLKFFSHTDKCCLFILHIQPGVKYFTVTSDLAGGEVEKEILIEGNGTFYQDKEKTTSGFRQLTLQEVKQKKDILDTYNQFFRTEKDTTKKVGVFEAYYFPPTRQGGRRNRRKTYRIKKNRRRQTRKRT